MSPIYCSLTPLDYQNMLPKHTIVWDYPVLAPHIYCTPHIYLKTGHYFKFISVSNSCKCSITLNHITISISTPHALFWSSYFQITDQKPCPTAMSCPMWFLIKGYDTLPSCVLLTASGLAFQSFQKLKLHWYLPMYLVLQSPGVSFTTPVCWLPCVPVVLL